MVLLPLHTSCNGPVIIAIRAAFRSAHVYVGNMRVLIVYTLQPNRHLCIHAGVEHNVVGLTWN